MSTMNLETPRRKRRRLDVTSSPSTPLSTDDQYKKDMYISFVRNALQRKLEGNGTEFYKLVGRFKGKRIDTNSGQTTYEARLWIAALTHVVSTLERSHAPLVEALIEMDLTKMDEIFIKSYVRFMAMLISAKPEYLQSLLSRVVEGFNYDPEPEPSAPSGASSQARDGVLNVVHNHLHDLLRRLLLLVPTMIPALKDLIIEHFPYKKEGAIYQTVYISNLLKMASYCPDLRDSILATIVDRTLQIDVEIQVELDDLDDPMFDPGALSQDPALRPPSLGSDDDDTDSFSDVSWDESSEDAPSRHQAENIARVRDMIAKLDAILKLLFDHILGSESPSFLPSTDTESNPSTPTDPTRSLFSTLDPQSIRISRFDILLSIFDRAILSTFKSRYTQFLLFWYSSIHSDFCDRFLGLLVARALQESDTPSVIRCAAAAYVASFVSRAQFVEREMTRGVMGSLCGFLQGQLDSVDQLIANNDKDYLHINTTHFEPFYAVAQAVFLIFCFRWRDLLGDDAGIDELDDIGISNTAGKRWIPHLDIMQRVISSPLNPLKFCSPNVAQQFARVSQSTGLVYCYNIMENNKRAEWGALSVASVGADTKNSTPTRVVIQPEGEGKADLRFFFPFDPYKLPLSQSYITGIYREWNSVAIDDDEDEGESDDEGDGRPSEMQVLDPAEVVQDPEEELTHGFGGMSISPMRPQLQALNVLA
ncbi:hypothetical protein FRB99_001229 [Tulasnella sp. 403]|nr:hypothetical protein FRB99_001229 [Tulasnella sp. 403]